ncbi:MAG: restriction endonuclease subunit R, partial [Propionibacterium sp.]|nr:restriction endonuclease subunit R [Propionibacterium sp.]
RLRPDLFGPGRHKTGFLVFDFCGNLEFFSQDLPTTEGSIQKSLTQRIFESRLDLVRGLDAAGQDADLRADVARALHEVVAGMNLDNVIVRPHRRDVEHFSDRANWAELGPAEAERAAELSGLPSAVRDTDEYAKRFDLLILRRQLAQLEGDARTAEKVRESVQAIAAALLAKTTIPSVAEQAELLEEVAGDEWWVDVTPPMLELARLRLRGLTRFIDKTKRSPVYTDFTDELGPATEVHLPGVVPGTDLERFRAKAAAYLKAHQDHIALQRLRRNKQLTPDDLVALEEILLASGVGERSDLDSAAEVTGGLGLFVRSLVGLDRAAVAEAFAGYLDETKFTVNQIRFVNLIVDELTANGVMEIGRLFESPFTDQAPTGPDYIFQDAEVDTLVGIINEFRTNALPDAG